MKLGAKQNAMSEFQIRVTFLFPHKMKRTYSIVPSTPKKKNPPLFSLAREQHAKASSPS
jgi:hypothetical protein